MEQTTAKLDMDAEEFLAAIRVGAADGFIAQQLAATQDHRDLRSWQRRRAEVRRVDEDFESQLRGCDVLQRL